MAILSMMYGLASQKPGLVYDATLERLSGRIGTNPPFSIKAFSGGSRGHKSVTPKVAARYLHNQGTTDWSHYANTPEVTDAHGEYVQRGGTLPPGHYTCHYVANHPTFHECIQLRRQEDAKAIYSPFWPRPIPHLRTDSFFIHGHGPKGSDGCIVPADEAERLRMNGYCKGFHGTLILLVKNVSYRLPAEMDWV